MIDGKSVLAVICARGSSKGLRRKNVLEVGGKPMLAWSIEAAKASRYLDRCVLSSDDPEIIATAEELGCEAPFVRPPELATDGARIEEALIHALDAVGGNYDYLVLLQATSPLRIGEDIDATLERCVETGAPVCVAVTEPGKSPYWMFKLDEAERLVPLFSGTARAGRRRQDLPAAYAVTGAVYVAEAPWFRAHRTFFAPETVAYVMPAERSLDVDSAWDLEMVRALLAWRASQPRNDAIPRAGRDA